MKGSMVKSFVFAALVLVFVLSLVCQSEAQRVRPVVLKGTYGVIGHDVCVGHWYDPPGEATGTTYWTKTSTIQGISTFGSDGNGTGEFAQLSITHPIYTPIPSGSYWALPLPDSSPLGVTSTSNISITFSYSIDPVTREITQVISGSGHFTSGPYNGKYLTFEEYTQTGFVSLDKGTIISSTIPLNATPNEADFTRIVSIWNDRDHLFLYAKQQETCQRNRVSTQIGLE